MQNYEACIECCEKAVEIGRDTRADFKLIGRALARIGNSYFKLDKLEEAIRYYNKSLTEHRTPDILNKLRETEQLKEKKEKEAYIDPKLSDEEREKGNVFFKSNQFPEAVKCYTEAIKRNPSDPKNYSNRAACYTKLMALPEAERDCDEAIKLDEFFVKAYIRKAAVQFSKKEFTKCTETCNLGISKDKEGKHTAELQGQVLDFIKIDSKSLFRPWPTTSG
jgi:stress-induced-phosphoprotein 1